MSTAFTYQGHLMDKKKPADGLYDLQFKLFDDPNVILGNQVGSDIQEDDVDVIDSYFTLELDFGSDVFDGNAVWLETGVRPGELEDPNVYTILEPRVELTPTPYALAVRVPLALQGAIEGGSLITADNSISGITSGFEAAHANDVLSFGVKGGAVNTTTYPNDPDGTGLSAYGPIVYAQLPIDIFFIVYPLV